MLSKCPDQQCLHNLAIVQVSFLSVVPAMGKGTRHPSTQTQCQRSCCLHSFLSGDQLARGASRLVSILDCKYCDGYVPTHPLFFSRELHNLISYLHVETGTQAPRPSASTLVVFTWFCLGASWLECCSSLVSILDCKYCDGYVPHPPTFFSAENSTI